MAIYRYNSSALIDEIHVVKNASGGLRAYLHARDDASAQQLAGIQQNLLQKGFKGLPVLEAGKPQLEIRGFKTVEGLLHYCAGQGWVQGQATVISQPDDVVTRKDRLRNLTLRFAGLLYNVGDIAFMTYAIMGRHDAVRELKKVQTHSPTPELLESAKHGVKGANFEIAGGIGYALGGIVLSVFGSKDQSQHEIKSAVQKVNRYLQKEGVAIPEDSSAHEITRPEHKGPLKAFTGLISRLPSETLNTIYTGVGIFLASGALKRIQSLKMKRATLVGTEEIAKINREIFNDVKDTGLGTVTMTSALAGLLINEKKPIEGQPKRQVTPGLGGWIHEKLAGAWEWIQEKPLRATGYGFMISTAFHAWATMGKYKEGDAFVRRTVIGRAIFVAANIGAEILLTVSSKGHGQGVKADDSVEKTVIASTAELISQQNPAQHTALVNQLAGYMASENVLGGKAERIAAELQTQLASLTQNPWARQAAVADAKALQVQPELSHTMAVSAEGKLEVPATVVSHVPDTKVTAVAHTAPSRALEANLV